MYCPVIQLLCTRYSDIMLGIRKKSVVLVICIATVLLISYKAEDGHVADDDDSYMSEANNATDHETNNVDDVDKLMTDKSVNEKAKLGKKLPEVAVVGVKKCGTGALIEVLRMHPGIVAPPYDKTEILFWGQEQLMGRGLDHYKVQKIKYFLFLTHSQWPEAYACLQTQPKGCCENPRPGENKRQGNTNPGVPSIA